MHPIVVRAALMAALAVSATSPAAAQSQTKLEGVINDYSDVANATPWHIAGDWSVILKGNSGKADFVASLTMVRTPSAVAAHTHHIALLDGTVTQLANGTGFTITGDADMTGNGAPAGFTGDPITVLITGDPSTVRYSNIAITFGGTGSTSASGHFDPDPVNGVVTSQLP